jgi:hypothetical protein
MYIQKGIRKPTEANAMSPNSQVSQSTPRSSSSTPLKRAEESGGEDAGDK